MIKKFFKNKYEKESFLKAFLLYVFSITALVLVIFYFHYRSIVLEQKQLLFLEMKNFALSFKGEKFALDLFSLRDTKKVPFYELLENDKEFYMYILIPDVKTDVLKIKYSKSKFFEDLKVKIEKLYFLYSVVITFVLILSLLFAIYTTKPLRKAIEILNETIKDIIHDINTPVMSILVNLKLLKLKYSNDDDVNRLEIAVEQLSNIYKNLKTALEETKKVVEEFNLRQIIEDELKTLISLYPNINVEKNLESVVLKANKEAVERIVFNLLSNSFKHNIKDGYIKITLNYNKLVIENSSPEIKNPNKLFDRYYKEGQRGIGLGLSIVKKLVDELGWKLKVKIEKNRFIAIILIR